MIIKNEFGEKRRAVVGIVFCLSFWIIATIILLLDNTRPKDKEFWTFFWTVESGLILFNMLYDWGLFVLNFRTLILSEKGIEVKIAFYSKFYRWQDFIVKKIEYYDGARRPDPGYYKGAVFSPYIIHKRLIKIPIEERFHIHVFSVVYINFPRDNDPNRKYTVSYAADENNFRMKMKEWGVDLEESSRRGSYNTHS